MKRPFLKRLARRRRRLTALFVEFIVSEQASGAILILCTLAALALANTPAGENFHNLWQIKLGFDIGGVHLKYDLEHWINDGLMAFFFLLIGLEIERELYVGELSDIRNASLPIIAAIGGMVTPALIYLLSTWGAGTRDGFGIPMATDIAFALGILALVGKGIPASLKVVLTALAIIDDLGAIGVIAIFYSSGVSAHYLTLALGVFLILLAGNRLKIHNLAFYLALGAVMWYLILQSGIHAAVAGVLLAFAIPFERGHRSSPSHRLQHSLHKPVAFVIMPLFALANTGIALTGTSLVGLVTPNTAGIFLGLLIGKPVGIILSSLLANKLGFSQLPNGLSVRHLTGAGFLGGIGFTMAIFVTFLAFGNTPISDNSKLAVLLSSIIAGLIGYTILRRIPAEPEQELESEPGASIS